MVLLVAAIVITFLVLGAATCVVAAGYMVVMQIRWSAEERAYQKRWDKILRGPE